MRIQLLSTTLILILIFTAGCTKGTPEEQAATEYYDNLIKDDWEGAYAYLSSPSKEKIQLTEFKAWGQLVNSVQEPQDIKVVKETQINDFGNNEDMLIFDEAKILTAEVTSLDKVTEASKELKENLHIVMVKEKDHWKVYVKELEKAFYFKELGRKFQLEKDYVKAATEYKKAILENEDDIWAKYHLAQNLAKLKKSQEATELMEDVISQNEMILFFTPVEELKQNLIEEYTFLISLLDKDVNKEKIKEYQLRIEELKLK